MRQHLDRTEKLLEIGVAFDKLFLDNNPGSCSKLCLQVGLNLQVDAFHCHPVIDSHQDPVYVYLKGLLRLVNHAVFLL